MPIGHLGWGIWAIGPARLSLRPQTSRSVPIFYPCPQTNQDLSFLGPQRQQTPPPTKPRMPQSCISDSPMPLPPDQATVSYPAWDEDKTQ